MPIVYDGSRGSSHGDLFTGIKLFISHRVPQRERWVSLVQGNGGKVVKLEKQADMLIADHVKRGNSVPPQGSYSWQWIDYSIKNGFLQPKEDYLIEEPGAARAVVTSVPAKTKRTPFSALDDDILTTYVLDLERGGASTRGIIIFKEFEKQHPHHTWQSWRDRWVKHLSTRPRPKLSQNIQHHEPRVGNLPGRHEVPVDLSLQPQPGPSNQYAGPSGNPALASTKWTKSHGENLFTPEDDRLLLGMIRETKEYNRNAAALGKQKKRIGGSKLFQDFAEQNPSHTWSSWRDRWVSHLSFHDTTEENGPRFQYVGGPEGLIEQNQPQTTANRDVGLPHSPSEMTTAWTKGRGIASSPSSKTIPSVVVPAKKRPHSRSDDERLKRQEQIRRRARAAKLLQRIWRGHAVRRDCAELESSVVPLQSLVRGYLLRVREAEKLLDAQESRNQPLEQVQDRNAEQDDSTKQYEDAQEALILEEADEDVSSAKHQFYDDLQDYLDVSGVEIERDPVIDGRQIELWDLFLVATQQDCEPEERDWKNVARQLGFDPNRYTRCAEELRNFYSLNLADFEEIIGTYGQQDPAEGGDGYVSRDDEQRLSSPLDAVQASTRPSPSLMSSPDGIRPPARSLKRSFHQSDFPSSDLGYPSDGSSKRRRLEYRKSIPSTPEDKLGMKGERRNGAIAQEFPRPGNSQEAAAGPTGDFSAGYAEDFLNDGMHSIQGQLDDLPNLVPPKRKRFVEPETQDFGLALGGDGGMHESIESGNFDYMNEVDNSPSQQLRSESTAFSSPARNTANQPLLVERRQKPLGAPADVTDSSDPRPLTSKAITEAPAYGSIPSLQPAKRSLPRQYQKQPAQSAIARSPIPSYARNGFSAPQLQPNVQIPSQHLQIALANSPQNISPLAKQTARSTAKRAVPASTQPQPRSRAVASSSKPAPSLKHGQKDPSDVESIEIGQDYVDAQFEHFTALGYEVHHIGQAMEAASLQRGPMTVALQSLDGGKGIPRDKAGVWTEDDDEKLRKVRNYDRRHERGVSSPAGGQGQRERARVERYRKFLTEKHGKWYPYRLAFMDMVDKGTDP